MSSMSPSNGITPGQIAKFLDVLAAKLRKSGLPSAETQQVLETQGDHLTTSFVSEVRKRVEAISGMIRRTVSVDRTRTPKQTLYATGRRFCIDYSVVASMPRGEGNEVEVVFFKLDRFVSDNDLDKEYDLRGLKPADPYSLAQVNTDDPSFADEHPNATYWKDANGKWCFATFYQWDGGGGVSVVRNCCGWGDDWWFAGVRTAA